MFRSLFLLPFAPFYQICSEVSLKEQVLCCMPKSSHDIKGFFPKGFISVINRNWHHSVALYSTLSKRIICSWSLPYLEVHVNMHFTVSLTASPTTHIKEEFSLLPVYWRFPYLSAFLSYSTHKNFKDKGISLVFNVSKTAPFCSFAKWKHKALR